MCLYFSLLTRLLLSLPPFFLLLPLSVLLPAGSTLLVSWNDGAMERTLRRHRPRSVWWARGRPTASHFMTDSKFILLPWSGLAADRACHHPVELCRNGWQERSSQGRRCICSCSLPAALHSPPPPPPLLEPRTGAERLTCSGKNVTHVKWMLKKSKRSVALISH